MEKGLFIKTTTLFAELAQVVTRPASFLCWPTLMNVNDMNNVNAHLACFYFYRQILNEKVVLLAG